MPRYGFRLTKFAGIPRDTFQGLLQGAVPCSNIPQMRSVMIWYAFALTTCSGLLERIPVWLVGIDVFIIFFLTYCSVFAVSDSLKRGASSHPLGSSLQKVPNGAGWPPRRRSDSTQLRTVKGFEYIFLPLFYQPRTQQT